MAGFNNYQALGNVSGANVADVSLPASTTTTVFTTGTLQPGTYLVSMSALVNSATGGASIEMQATTGTATATLTGETAAQSIIGSAAGYATLAITFVAVVTVAGTLILRANPSAASTAHYNTNVQLWGNATGWTALKIA